MKFKMTAGLTLAFCAGIAIAKAQNTPPPPPQPPNANTPPANRPQRAGGRAVEVADPNAPATKYDYHDTWKPFFYTKNGNDVRAADGQPGPKYWQNRADYQLA